jgi:hypothetical protein
MYYYFGGPDTREYLVLPSTKDGFRSDTYGGTKRFVFGKKNDKTEIVNLIKY